MLDSVRAKDMLGSKVEHLGAQSGVCAGIRYQPHGMGNNHPIPGTAGLHCDLHRMPLKARPDRLGAGVVHPHRSARTQRQQCAVRLDIQFILAAK
ncbi:hypothetical protein D3C71_1492520 [compost metagenome]